MARQQRENSEFSMIANVLVLVAVFVFLVMYSPLNGVSGIDVSGFAVRAPKTVTYNTQNIPLESGSVPEAGCYDSDAPTGGELLKTQAYIAGLVDSSGMQYYDACASENEVEENICASASSGVQRESRIVQCPEGMACGNGKCA